MRERSAFAAFAKRKTDEASAATIRTLTTELDEAAADGLRIGNEWTRRHYDGDFGLAVSPETRTNISLVFVQSRDGNTGTNNPGELGGGDTDTHLIYEGLTRVAADGVLVGARTLHPNSFFSVWHPELVKLRQSLGFLRHPAQIVVSKEGDLDFSTLLFNLQEAPVFLIGGDQCLTRHASSIIARPWIEFVSLGSGLAGAIDVLRTKHRIHRISAVGGRATATRLVDEGLVQDIYLTTSSRAGGQPNTPWYAGRQSLTLEVTTKKSWAADEGTAVLEHIAIR